jgi:eukaryotic-like serine/threonine-protein kinase
MGYPAPGFSLSAMQPGTHLGPYEIISAIGRGGMGEVFRARDTRLGREVAIKVASEEFGERFEREARAISSLNHPNICTLYDVGPNYLVMELLDGQTLAARIREGALPLNEALAIARQMADALEAAHDRGITHRDLKPGNVIVRDDGTVKVLDFGLAKVGPHMAASGEGQDNSPTISMAATQAGVILGTAAYMAPEQARGKPVDKRADIWAFGVVLYEMVTGRRLFQGEDLTETLASVVKERPDLSAAPPSLRRLLEKCLEKDPKKRLRDISSVALLLEDGSPAADGVRAAPGRRQWLWPAATAVAVLAAALVAWAPWRQPPPAPAPWKLSLEPPSGTEFSGGLVKPSPDGRWVLFSARRVDAGDAALPSLWVRPIDSLDPRELPGTEGGANQAFWSADSRSVAFVADEQLRRIDIQGGTPQTILSPVSGFGGGTWSPEGVIVVSASGRLLRVPETGGESAPALAADPDLRLGIAKFSPFFLPDGRTFLFRVWGSTAEGIYAASLDQAGPPVRLLSGAYSNAAFARGSDNETGYLLWVPPGQALHAQRLNPRTLELEGPPVQIAQNVAVSDNNYGRWASFSPSASGLLTYVDRAGEGVQMSWVGRDGTVGSQLGKPMLASGLRLSPTADRAAVVLNASGNVDIRVIDLVSGREQRMTQGEEPDVSPVWSPDGRDLAFASIAADGQMHIYRTDTSGGGQRTRVGPGSSPMEMPLDWIDAGLLIQSTSVPNGDRTYWLIAPDGKGDPVRLLGSPFVSSRARFAPGTRWLAYQSGESGRDEVYVRAEPGGPDGQTMVSVAGGGAPLWRADGKELFYVSPSATSGTSIMAVSVQLFDDHVEVGEPHKLFDTTLVAGQPYDVTPDGQRFLMLLPTSGPSADGALADYRIQVVGNWQAALKAERPN